MRDVRDRARDHSSRHPVLVTLVKADAQAPPLNIQQAMKVLRLDICRKILSDSRDINPVHLWGFYNSSPKTADAESDVWVTLRSIGVPKPDHIYSNQQLAHLEERLQDDAALIMDLSNSEGSTENSCPTIRSFLQTHPVELLRLSALLETDAAMEQAEGAMQFYRTFLSVLDDHVMDDITGQNAKRDRGERDCSILQILTEQETRYHLHLNNFETRLALDVLWETMLLIKQHLESDAAGTVSPMVLLAARRRLVGHLASLGVTLHTEAVEPAADGKLSTVIDTVAAFRREVRSYALQDRKERGELMIACDGVRDSLLKAGVKLQDKKNQTAWLWAPTKK